MTLHTASSTLGGRLAARLLRGDLDEKVMKAYPAGGWDEYRATIAALGNPPDQIARFERAKIILQPKQLEFAAWARRLDTAVAIDGEQGAPELGMGGARGPGKSFGIFAQAAVDDCARQAALKVLYLRKTGKYATEQLEDLIAAVLGHVEHKYIRGLIRFPNGSQIRIGHFQTDAQALNYLGIEYDLIIIEEATTLSQRVHQAMRTSLRTNKTTWRPRAYNSTNPLGVAHKYYKTRFIDHERANKDVPNRTRKFIFATVDDNNFVNADYKGNLDELTGVARRAYRDGDWEVSAGAYFDQWRYDVHVVAPLRPLAGWRVWASMDYGFNHWNVILLHAQDGDGTIYTFDELATRKKYPDEVAPLLHAKLASYDLSATLLRAFVAGADVFSATGSAKKTVAQQYKDLGFRLTTAKMEPGSRVAGAHHLAKLLGKPDEGRQPRWLVASTCRRLIDTMPYLECDPNHPEDVLKVDADENGEGGDDAYDAARYGLYGDVRKPITAEVSRYA